MTKEFIPKYKHLFTHRFSLYIIFVILCFLGILYKIKLLQFIYISLFLIIIISLILCADLIKFNSVIFNKYSLKITKGMLKKKIIIIPFKNILMVYNNVFPYYPDLNYILIEYMNGSNMIKIKINYSYFTYDEFKALHQEFFNYISKDKIKFVRLYYGINE